MRSKRKKLQALLIAAVLLITQPTATALAEIAVPEKEADSVTVESESTLEQESKISDVIPSDNNNLEEMIEEESVSSNDIIATQDNASTTLEVTFDNDNGGGTSDSVNEMKNAIETALSGRATNSFTTIKFVGNATQITNYNWKYLLYLYMQSSSSWSALSTLDLSGLQQLTTIGDWEMGGTAFPKLKTVLFPDSLETIGKNAFKFCSGLTAPALPTQLKTIGNGAFSNCSALTTITLPDSVTEIMENAFSFCSNLSGITLSLNLKTIKGTAFLNCKKLSSVTLPASLTDIHSSAFNNCTGLTEFQVEQGNSTFTSRDGLLYTDNMATLFRYPPGKTDGTFIVPSDVQAIGDSAFNSCNYLTALSLPDNLTRIGKDAFRYCEKLKAIIFPENLTTIGEYAFSNCTGLTNLNLPENLAHIEANAFDNCTGLIDVAFPDGMQSIGSHAFTGCYKLTSLIFPASLISVGSQAFYGCYNLGTLTFKGSTPPSIGADALTSSNNSGNIYYPSASNAYTEDWRNNELELTRWKLRKSIPINLPGVTLHGSVGYGGTELWVIGLNGSGVNSESGTATLLSKSNLSSQTSFGSDSQYNNSDLKDAMETYYNTLIDGEKDMIEYRDLTNVYVYEDDNYNATIDYYNENYEDIYVWPLSLPEARILPENIRNNGSEWWLRSAFNSLSEHNADIAGADGSLKGFLAVGNASGMRPALTVNLSDVLFTTSAAGIKSNATPGSKDLKEFETTGTVSLTVQDDSNLKLTLDSTDPITAKSGGTVNIRYSDAAIGAGHSVSILLCDTNGNILYYGRPGDCQNSRDGTASFTLPASLSDGNYKLLVFNELVNGNYYTDFASTPKEINLTVNNTVIPPPPHIHTYGSDWKSDATRHWKECLSGDGARNEEALHDYTPWTIDKKTDGDKAGTSSRECKVCGYKHTETNTYRTLTDPDTGIQVSGYFTSDAAISVKKDILHEEGTCPVCDEIRVRQTAGELIAFYDITLSSGIHNGEVKISFPVDKQYNGQPLILLHCMDRQEERREEKAKEGFVTGTFTSLSPFAVLETTKVQSVKLTPSSLTLELEKSRQLQATVSPTDAYDKKVTWKTSNKKVATVSASGLVKAVKAGTATITCTAADGGGAKATCKVTVKNTATPILIMKGTAGKNSIRLNWNQISNADGYEIYGSRCGGKYSYKKIKTITKGVTKTWTQSKLKSATAYKYYIKAYKLVNGKKLYLRVSKTCHVTTTGGWYTNAKSVTTTFTDITLAKEKTRQISACIIPVKKGRKLANHVPEFRYKTTNSKVATVTASGKIKAVGKGKCSVYVYANNGVTRRIQITVK